MVSEDVRCLRFNMELGFLDIGLGEKLFLEGVRGVVV